MNPSAREDRPTFLLRATAGVFAGLLVAAGIVLWGVCQDLDALHHGFDKGFELRGTYSAIEEQSGRYYRITFDYEEETWQVDWGGRNSAAGTYLTTGDPNQYQLNDAEGNIAGWAHVAYANARGEGLLYLRYGDETVKLDKRTRIPGIVEDNGRA